MAKVEIRIVPKEGMQTLALQSPADEMFMGGQAGPGKSWVLIVADLMDAFEHPDLRVLFLRRRMPELADLLEKATKIYTPLGAKFFSQHPLYLRPAFQFPEYDIEKDVEGNIVSLDIKEGQEKKPTGALFVFGHMDMENTKYAYGGFEFQRINWDELPNFLEGMYTFMWSRLRSANHDLRCVMRATGNPNGIGVKWVKRRFIDPMPANALRAFTKIGNRDVEVPIGTKGSKTRTFLPGYRWQNDSLDNESYEAGLAQLSGKDYAALALGKWEVEDAPGQLIASNWLDKAMSGKVEPLRDEWQANQPAIAFDYATDRGADRSCFLGGRGNRPLEIKTWNYTRQVDAAYIVHLGRVKYGRDYCKVAIDANGAGIGLAEMLEDGRKEVLTTLPEFQGRTVDIDPIPQLERCTDVDRHFTDLWKARARKNFPNFRSQMYWKLANDFENDRIDLSYLSNNPDYLDDLEELQKELLAITFEERNGMIYICPKHELKHPDRLGRSPDRADTLAMWNWVRDHNPIEKKEYTPDGDLVGEEYGVGDFSSRMLV